VNESRTSATQIVLVSLLALGVGAAGTFALLPRSAPASLGVRVTSATFPVDLARNDDAQSVSLSLKVQSLPSIPSPAAGVVTSTTCSAGESIASGSAPFAISGVPILALSTTVPPWRDLTPGLKGPDVTAVQAALVKLGYAAGQSGSWDRSTERAVGALEQHLGIPTHSGSLRLGDFAWLPEPTVTVQSCPALLGQTVGAGSPIATPVPRIVAATVGGIQSGLLPGNRLVRVGSLTIAVPAGGSITDPAAITELVDSPQAAPAVATLGTASPLKISADYELADPPLVAQLPVSAVHVSSSGGACVFTSGLKPLAVKIVGSSLGKTTAEFVDSPAPKFIRLQAPIDGKCV
jgi:hypothetical protein